MTLDRRKATLLLAAAGLLGAGGIPPFATASAQETTVDVEKLMAPGALEDMVLGDPAAKVTIVEYMSLTCPHCANFHKNVFPKLKEKYVDTGKAKFVLREFPLDQVAWAASMVARCADKSKFFPLIGVLFDKQAVWAPSKDPAGELFKLAKQAGMTKETFDACLQNKELAQNVLDVKDRGATEFNVNSTPTLFVNGQRVADSHSIEAFDKIIEPLL